MISRRKRCRCARFDRRNVDVRSAAMILRFSSTEGNHLKAIEEIFAAFA